MKKLWTGLAFWVLAALASLFLGAAALSPMELLTGADSASSILLSQDCFGYSRFFVFPYKL